MPTAPASTPRACSFPHETHQHHIHPIGRWADHKELQVDFEEKVGFANYTWSIFSMRNVGWRRIRLPLLYNHKNDKMVEVEVRPGS